MATTLVQLKVARPVVRAWRSRGRGSPPRPPRRPHRDPWDNNDHGGGNNNMKPSPFVFDYVGVAYAAVLSFFTTLGMYGLFLIGHSFGLFDWIPEASEKAKLLIALYSSKFMP